MEILRELHIQQKKKIKILLFPLPLQGHINPMLQLANILYSRGFSISVIHTNFNSPSPSNYPDFTFHSIPEVLSGDQASSYTEDIITLITVLNVTCHKPFSDVLAKLLSDSLEEEPIACLITDADWPFAQGVADSFRLPRIVLRTSNISSYLVYEALPTLRGYFPITDLGSEELIPEIPPLKVKDLPIIKTKNIEDFYQLIFNMTEKSKACSGLIWNTFQDLEQLALVTCQEVFPVPSFLLGPLHKYFQVSLSSSLLAQDPTSISWLDSQAPKSVLYVSFGSVAAITQTELLEIAWGLVNSNQHFLWVVRPGSVSGSEWLEQLPDGFYQMMDGRGHIVKWAPQQEVLAHPATGGFWTHCGWNSTLESISEGVPMICLPLAGDQKVNARYVSDVWKIGIHLEGNLHREEIERAIKTLMVDVKGYEIRERIMSLKEKVNLCLTQEGSSQKFLDSLVKHILSF